MSSSEVKPISKSLSILHYTSIYLIHSEEVSLNITIIVHEFLSILKEKFKDPSLSNRDILRKDI